MTGFRSKHFRHDCGTKGCYYEQLPSWDYFINDCFPRRIIPTDVDGMVEVDGRFLFLEEKGKGAGPSEGQRRALLRLSKLPDVTVVLFRTGAASDLEVLAFRDGSGSGWKSMSVAEFKSSLARWSGVV